MTCVASKKTYYHSKWILKRSDFVDWKYLNDVIVKMKFPTLWRK